MTEVQRRAFEEENQKVIEMWRQRDIESAVSSAADVLVSYIDQSNILGQGIDPEVLERERQAKVDFVINTSSRVSVGIEGLVGRAMSRVIPEHEEFPQREVEEFMRCFGLGSDRELEQV